VTEILRDDYGIETRAGQRNECPFCGKKTFSITNDDSLGKCFHPACERFIKGRESDMSKGGGGQSRKTGATVQPVGKGCGLEEYAEAKKLPVGFLTDLGLSEISYCKQPAVKVIYFDEEGNEAATRYRTALKKENGADNRFRWKRGTKPILYGLWRLSEAEKKGFVVMVEGESDCHTLWFHTVPAVGIPGANSWKEEWADYFKEIAAIYVVVEPDAGGEAVVKWVKGSKIRDKVFVISLKNVKDPSELHLKEPENFKTVFNEALSNAKKFEAINEIEVAKRRNNLWKRCSDIAVRPNILDSFLEQIRLNGVVGEDRAVKLIYLIFTSRVLGKPVSCVVKGPSSCGKSFVVEKVVNFFPENACYEITAMSERALAYSEEPLKHRFIIVYEAVGIKGDFASYLIRSLLSEGKLRYETVEKTGSGLKPRLIEREGPTGLIVTTTSIHLHPENETRMLSIPVNDSAEQTSAILMIIARESNERPDLSRWIAFQEWIGLGSNAVFIPFASRLAELIPSVAVRLRRDFSSILSLIKVNAILHQMNRKKDEQNRIIATLEDYRDIRDLIIDLISEGVDSSVSDNVRETVEAVERLQSKKGRGIKIVEVGQELKLDKSAAWRRVRAAIDKGYLRNNQEKKGKPAEIVLGDPLPADVEILPSVEKLSGCTVAENLGSLDPPPFEKNGIVIDNDGSNGNGKIKLPADLKDWPEEWKERFAERAARMEIEDGLNRDIAIKEAEKIERERFRCQ